jgi:hypothetical protein
MIHAHPAGADDADAKPIRRVSTRDAGCRSCDRCCTGQFQKISSFGWHSVSFELQANDLMAAHPTED